MLKKNLRCLVLLLALLALFPSQVRAGAASDTGRFQRGFFNMSTAAFQLPFRLVNSTLTQPFPFGVAHGAVSGTFYTVTQMVGGAFDMGAAAAPYAKYAVLL